MKSALRVTAAAIFGTLALVLLLPVMVLGLPFIVIRRLAELLQHRLQPPAATWQSICEFFPGIGWKPRPNLDVFALSDDVFHLTTDPDGWRGRTTLGESQVVVFGDSHGFGHGVDDRDYFGHRTNGVRVKAIAANGYNMLQEVMWMQRLSSELMGKLVVWFVFPGNDILDNLEVSMGTYRSPFLRQKAYNGEWETVNEHIGPSPWSFDLQKYRVTDYDRVVKVFCPSAAADRAFAACDHLMTEAQATCKRAGAQLVVFTIPDPIVMSDRGLKTLEMHGAKKGAIDPTLPDKRLGGICQARGIPMIAGMDYLTIEDYKEHDDHWNTKGHKRVAEIIEHCYSLYMSAKDPDAAATPQTDQCAAVEATPSTRPAGHRPSDQP